ncbi:MAG: acyl-CoA thioesterase [Paludibacteraceae bacterium]|nr:acyl-CoA thioesterase [Paludibacteraceae bacterium]
MRKRKTEQTPTNLVDKAPLRVRFSETDGIGVVWHGEYIRYFEDGRESFGENFGLPYLDVFKAGYVIPIVDVTCQYVHSLHAGERATIETRYISTPAAKILFEYAIYKEPEHILCATGTTTQVFINEKTGELELSTPEFYLNWKKKWDLIK